MDSGCRTIRVAADQVACVHGTFMTLAAKRRKYIGDSVAHRAHDVQLRRRAKESLKYPAVEFNGVQARAVSRGIAAIVPKVGLLIHACAIMPDHVHLVIAKHRMDGDD